MNKKEFKKMKESDEGEKRQMTHTTSPTVEKKSNKGKLGKTKCYS